MSYLDRAALLTAGRTTPQNPEEELLMYAYHCALESQSLVKAYIGYPGHDNWTPDHMQAFVLGYSAGSAVLKFTTTQRGAVSDYKLN